MKFIIMHKSHHTHSGHNTLISPHLRNSNNIRNTEFRKSKREWDLTRKSDMDEEDLVSVTCKQKRG